MRKREVASAHFSELGVADAVAAVPVGLATVVAGDWLGSEVAELADGSGGVIWPGWVRAHPLRPVKATRRMTTRVVEPRWQLRRSKRFGMAQYCPPGQPQDAVGEYRLAEGSEVGIGQRLTQPMFGNRA